MLETVTARRTTTVLLGIAPDRPETEYGWIEPSDLIAGVPTLLGRIGRAAPALIEAFGPARARLGTPWEVGAAAAVYATLPSVDFSRAVLTPSASALGVMPVTGVEWNDLGDPGRVVTARRRMERALAMA